MGIVTSSCRGKSTQRQSHTVTHSNSKSEFKNIHHNHNSHTRTNSEAGHKSFKEAPRIRIYKELERLPNSRRNSHDSIESLFLNSRNYFISAVNQPSFNLSSSNLTNSGAHQRPIQKTQSLFYLKNFNNSIDKACQVNIDIIKENNISQYNQHDKRQKASISGDSEVFYTLSVPKTVAHKNKSSPIDRSNSASNLSKRRSSSPGNRSRKNRQSKRPISNSMNNQRKSDQQKIIVMPY